MQHTGVKTEVRMATLQDIPQLVPMLREFAEFASLKYSLFPSESDAASIIAGIMYSHPFFVSTKGDELTGCIAGLATPHIFNPSLRILTESFWWVSPAHRGTRAGLLLLEALLDWGKQHVDLIVVSLETISPVREETLEKRGLLKRETNFILEV